MSDKTRIERIIAIEEELAWMELDGLLTDSDAQQTVDQMLELNHKLRKLFEIDDQYDHQKRTLEALGRKKAGLDQ
jgi:hypothetical protein